MQYTFYYYAKNIPFTTFLWRKARCEKIAMETIRCIFIFSRFKCLLTSCFNNPILTIAICIISQKQKKITINEFLLNLNEPSFPCYSPCMRSSFIIRASKREYISTWQALCISLIYEAVHFRTVHLKSRDKC